MAKKDKEPAATKKVAPLTEEQLAKLPPATGPWVKPGQVQPVEAIYLAEDVHGHYGVARWKEGLWWYRGLVRDLGFFKGFAVIH